jgi:hypothetical protein
MWRTIVFCGALATMAWSLASTSGKDNENQDQPAADDSYVKVSVDVEIRGTLQKQADPLQISARQRVYEIYHEDVELPYSAPRAWQLDFAQGEELKNVAARLIGRKVVLSGKCELRMLLHRPRPAIGSGFGPPPPPNDPTWALQPLVTVTDISAAE